MLNLHCNNNDKKKNIKKKKKKCDYRDSNTGYMGSKATKVSNTLWRQTHFTDKNNQYIHIQLYKSF